MVKTVHGDFSGDTWEEFCQRCFKLKYGEEGYQEMKASLGDYGIEGFTRKGKAFQCYCPDVEYTSKVLYEKQRDKITKDLRKLETYEASLKDYLKEVKINEWIFVTPDFRGHQLIKHCKEKAEYYRGKGLSILAPNFDVLVHDIEFLAAQIPIVRGYKNEKIGIRGKKEADNKDITEWRNQEISLVQSAVRKHQLRLPPTIKNLNSKVDRLTDNSIKGFLNGTYIIRTWQDSYPEDYEKFEKLKSFIERKVSEKCMWPTDDNNGLYLEIETDLKAQIKDSFPYLEPLTIAKLSEFVMADWILRCPIDFE